MAQQRVAAWVSSVDVLAWALLIVRCIKLRRELRFSAENDRCGSKCEKLYMSKCFPNFTQ